MPNCHLKRFCSSGSNARGKQCPEMAICYQCYENICSEACKESHCKGGFVFDQYFGRRQVLEEKYLCTGTPKTASAKSRANAAAWRDACNSAMELMLPPQPKPSTGGIDDLSLETSSTVSCTARVQDMCMAVPKEGKSIYISICL